MTKITRTHSARCNGKGNSMNTRLKALLATAVLMLMAWHPAARAEMSLYYIHNDHLGTPQVVTNEDQNVVWQADYQPFGEVDVTVNTLDQEARFPGQYTDDATGLHYNYFRDYDSSIGRYIQSDPLGLYGGLNTYGYAYQNPIANFDPDGRLVWFGIPVAYWIAGGAAFGAGASCVATNCGQVAVDGISMVMAGLQTKPNTITHGREREIEEMGAGFGGGGCDDLIQAIKDLTKTIKWRKGDLNPAEIGTRNYVNHVKRINNLKKLRDKIRRNAKDLGCDTSDCDV